MFSKLFNKKQNNPESKDKENTCPKQDKCVLSGCTLGKAKQHHNCILFKQIMRDEHELMKIKRAPT